MRSTQAGHDSIEVLVAEADTLGAVAVIRSLGRAGYAVHAVSRKKNALGFKSSFVSSIGICPPYSSPDFLPWLRAEIKNRKIRAIIPSEGFLLAIRSCFTEFSALIPFSAQNAQSLYSGLSKYDLFSNTHREHTPPLLLLDLDSSREAQMHALRLREKLLTLGEALYIKVDAVYAREGTAGKVIKATNADHALEVIAGLRDSYSKAVVQGHVDGRGVGVFFNVWQGEIIADFMHLRLHEVPHTGGISSLRSSFFHAEIYEDARKRILALGWQGSVMLEYRWNEITNRFYLLEMNARFWGSLHLPIYAGVDFPEILMRCFLGQVPPPSARASYRRDVFCRMTVPAEMQYILSLYKDPSVSIARKLQAVLEFVSLSLRPSVHSDLLSFPGDRMLFFHEACSYFRHAGSSLRTWLIGNKAK